MGITYKDAGVDVNAAERFVEELKATISSTFSPLVLNPIGGFASLLAVPKDYREPVLVTSTDGVGTKLKIAFLAKRHRTVGIDLVAMCANDILTSGAKPYFFLDYFACGRLHEQIFKDVLEGICEGCKEAGCALVGGETAEMPGLYRGEEYDLAGFVVGFVEKEKVVDGSKVREGDLIIGLPSSGLHSNGYSLARKILFEMKGFSLEERLEGFGEPLVELLLRPTRIYVKTVLELASQFSIHAMAHITGGGLPGNVKRVVPYGLTAKLELRLEEIPLIFQIISKLGPVSMEEMFRTFNMGIGFVLIVDAKEAEGILGRLEEMGEKASIIGSLIAFSGHKVEIELGGREVRKFAFY